MIWNFFCWLFYISLLHSIFFRWIFIEISELIFNKFLTPNNGLKTSSISLKLSASIFAFSNSFSSMSIFPSLSTYLISSAVSSESIFGYESLFWLSDVIPSNFSNSSISFLSALPYSRTESVSWELWQTLKSNNTNNIFIIIYIYSICKWGKEVSILSIQLCIPYDIYAYIVTKLQSHQLGNLPDKLHMI